MSTAFPDAFLRPSPLDAAASAAGNLAVMQALRAQHLRVVFQPQYALPTLQLCGFEALVRLGVGDADDGGEWLTPERFLPLAQAAGLMGALTLFMAESACRALKAWRDSGHAPVFIAVNIEPDDLADVLFAPRICGLLAAYGIGPGQLQMELVERNALHGGDTAHTNIRLLRAAGVRMAMDDFGTGHSSLSHLSDIPFDIVKIDKTFLARIPSDALACTLMTSVINMCLALRKEVVVEGVECDAQLHWLARLRWHWVRVQGNRLSYPMSQTEAGDSIPRHASSLRPFAAGARGQATDAR